MFMARRDTGVKLFGFPVIEDDSLPYLTIELGTRLIPASHVIDNRFIVLPLPDETEDIPDPDDR
jgi:hypothetical protein